MSQTPGPSVRYDYLGSIESIIANKVASSGFLGSLTWKLKSLKSLFSSKAAYDETLHDDLVNPDPQHATLLYEADGAEHTTLQLTCQFAPQHEHHKCVA